MKSFKKKLKAFKRPPNFFFMALAVLAATAMWYAVSVRDRVEAQVEVGLDYYGVPPNLIVTQGLVSKIIVRLRGPETLIRSIPREALHQAIDLSIIKKGENIVPLSADHNMLPVFRAFDVIDIQPPRIDIIADTLVERNVRLETKIDSPLGSDALKTEDVSVSPATVILRGPEQIISKISSLPVVIRPDPKAVGTQQIQMITLDTPSLVTASPAQVRVVYTITSGRVVVSRKYPITVAGDVTHVYETDPKDLTLLVEVPEALAGNNSYLDQLAATVVPPDLAVGQSIRLRPRFRLPEGMSLPTPYEGEITVTRARQ